MNKIFVGSLSWNTTDSDLNAAFEGFGAITESKVISDRNTGRSRGFGFVTFEAPESAEKAISEMNGSTLDGREITVTEAKEKRRDGGGGGHRGGGGGYGGGNRGGGGGHRGGNRGGGFGGGRDNDW